MNDKRSSLWTLIFHSLCPAIRKTRHGSCRKKKKKSRVVAGVIFRKGRRKKRPLAWEQFISKNLCSENLSGELARLLREATATRNRRVQRARGNCNGVEGEGKTVEKRMRGETGRESQITGGGPASFSDSKGC